MYACVYVCSIFWWKWAVSNVKIDVLVQAQIVDQIHHKNLVTLIGYCAEGEYMALVYEYMAQGTLEEHITGICILFVAID